MIVGQTIVVTAITMTLVVIATRLQNKQVLKIALMKTPRKPLTLRVNNLIARTLNPVLAQRAYHVKVLQLPKQVPLALEVLAQVNSVRPIQKTAVFVIHLAAQLAVYAEANKEQS